MPRSALTKPSVNDIRALQRDFERSQRAARRSPRTIETYREAIDQLAAFLERSGMPTAVPAIRRQHVEAFMNELHARTKPATASNRFRALQQFFKFAVEEEEIGRYLRLRAGHPFAASPALWLGKKGALSETGLTQMLWRRGERGYRQDPPAPVPSHVRPHLAGPGRERGRPGPADRMVQPRHALSLRRFHGRRAGP